MFKKMMLVLTVASLVCLSGCRVNVSVDKEETPEHDRMQAMEEDLFQTPEEEVEEVRVLNTRCPISGEDADPGETVDFKGTKVAFCCPKCVKAWNKMSDADKTTKLK